MGNRFASKIAIVTGGASGLGRDAAIAFGREGAKVLVADIADGEGPSSAIKDAGGRPFLSAPT